MTHPDLVETFPGVTAYHRVLIEDYAGGRVPLVVPLTLFARHIRRCGVPYLADQVYLRPHQDQVELMLRNHV